MKRAKFIAIFLSALLASCAGAQSDRLSFSKEPASNGGGRNSSNTTTTLNPPAAQQVSLDQAETSQNQPTTVERKIIRNADLQLEAASPEEAQQKITAIAESKDGFVVESQQSSSDVRSSSRDIVTMTVRVPAAKFNESLDEIRKTAARVIVETIKSDDVTEEFIDIEARLKAKKALETQFLEIMKQAKSVDDALSVQKQLAEVRGEIEKIEGRKRFLETQASLSTIKIRVQTPASFSTNSTGFFYRLGESISSGFDFALSFILGLVTFLVAILPFVIFIVLPILLVLRYLWRKWRKRKLATEIAREEIREA